MSIKHAVLGLVAESPGHGYVVRARFEQRMGDLVDLGSGRIYAVLSRLERDGLVQARTERVGRRARKIYSIRAAGRRELLAWAKSEPSPLESLCDLALRLLATGSDTTAAQAVVRAWQRQEGRALELLAGHAAGAELSEILRTVRTCPARQCNAPGCCSAKRGISA